MKSSTIVITAKGYKPQPLFITPNTMKYKVVAGSVLFDQLTALFVRIEECRKQTHAIVDEFGGTEWMGCSRRPLAGGISAFKLDKMPDGWKQVYKSTRHNAFFPKSIPKNKALLTRIAELPTVDRDDLNKIVGFKKQWAGMTQLTSPGVKFGYDFHLIEVAEEAHYIPLDGMEEITVSEFNQLKEIINKADEVALGLPASPIIAQSIK